jgi:hypothetical protein
MDLVFVNKVKIWVFTWVFTWAFPCILTGQMHISTSNSLSDLNTWEKVDDAIYFEYTNHFILVKVRMNGFPLQFILDTGAGYTILFDKEMAAVLNLELDRTVLFWGADRIDTLQAHVSRNVKVSVGNKTISTDVLVMEEDVFQLEKYIDAQIHGIIGGNFLRHFAVTIDYRKSKILLQSPNEFKEPKSCKSCKSFGIELNKNKPFLEAKVQIKSDDSTKVNLLLDSGAALGLLLYTHTRADLKPPEHMILSPLGLGLGGYIKGYIGRVFELDLAGRTYNNLITHFQKFEDDDGIEEGFRKDGLLGNLILGQHKITIDYIHKKLYLKPYSSKIKPFRFNRTGIIVIKGGESKTQYVVHHVIEGSPAADMGIMAGDLLTKISGWSINYYTLEDIEKSFTKRNRKYINLGLMRNGEKIKLKLPLRDLL